jgi:hypothetical protein
MKISFIILRVFVTALAIISMLLTFVFGYFLYQRAAMDFNSEGNYFDGIVTYHQQSITGYGVCFVISLLISVFLFFIVKRTYKV